jgi:hypothetical protein
MEKVKCKTCSSDMPQARFNLGYKNCTKCSNVQPYGCVHITNHKTGNEIQILPAELAEVANRYAERTSYGVLKTMITN